MAKKAQIKFGETFGIIIIVYIVLMVGMFWYNSSSNKEIARMDEENKEKRAFEKYYYVINNPWLHSSEYGDIDEEFDLVSLEVFNEYASSGLGKERVRRELGESNVSLKLIEIDIGSNEYQNFRNISIYDNSPDEFRTKEVFRTLLPVKDSVNEIVYMGILEVVIFD